MMSESPYQIIKRSIIDGIATGQWAVGQMLPSEHALCRSFAVSRMTVNRAMRELADAGQVRRVPGLGSFVAERVVQSGLVEIRNIADDILRRGHVHRAQVLALEEIAAPDAVAAAFDLPEQSGIFHSKILHFENNVPLQLEDRFVNPHVAPGYLAQDFSATTPNAFLSAVAPIREVEHLVQAITADANIAWLLELAPDEAVLLISRRTWSGNALASMASLYHPGARFRLGGRFAPDAVTSPAGADNE